LRNPGAYLSVSAFSPIVAPSQNLWGQKAFSGYIGNDEASWNQYDTCELVKNSQEKLPMFVDQGTDDEFLSEYLNPELLSKVCKEYNHPLNLRMQEGYDHSYYFIATFIEDHVKYHSGYLNA